MGVDVDGFIVKLNNAEKGCGVGARAEKVSSRMG